MSVYSNKFVIQNQEQDTVRILFQDEKMAAAEGLPMPIALVSEVVMTRNNFRQFVQSAKKMGLD